MAGPSSQSSRRRRWCAWFCAPAVRALEARWQARVPKTSISRDGAPCYARRRCARGFVQKNDHSTALFVQTPAKTRKTKKISRGLYKITRISTIIRYKPLQDYGRLFRRSCVKTHFCARFCAQGRVANLGLCVKSLSQAHIHARPANWGGEEERDDEEVCGGGSRNAKEGG